jgi:hypothetical protein
LASESQHLLTERLLPSIESNGQWSWAELRRRGVAWWLRGPKQLDAVIAKLAAAAVQRLRKFHAENDGSPLLERPTTETTKQHRKHIDETVFWFVAGRQQLELQVVTAQLRALWKTGVLKGEPGFEALLSHERSSDPSWIRQNAFSLLQKHRYHLATALLLMSGSLEDALRVVIRQLRDFQLAALLSRRNKEAIVPHFLEWLGEPVAQNDPWLQFLLAWHAGDKGAATAACQKDSSALSSMDPYPDDGEVKLFDKCMRPARSSAALRLLGQKLLDRWSEDHRQEPVSPTSPKSSCRNSSDELHGM